MMNIIKNVKMMMNSQKRMRISMQQIILRWGVYDSSSALKATARNDLLLLSFLSSSFIFSLSILTTVNSVSPVAIAAATSNTAMMDSHDESELNKEKKEEIHRQHLKKINNSKNETRLHEEKILYQLSVSPRIYIGDSVFTKDECERLIDSGIDKLKEAKIMGKDGKETKDFESKRKPRNADAVGLNDNDGDIVQLFRERMSNIAMMPELNGETLQLTRYKPGQYYDIHFDSSYKVGRLVTVLVFLSDVEEGGYLAFPWAKLYESKFERRKIDGITGTGRDVNEINGFAEEPNSETLCKPESNSLLIEPRLGRVVVFFNHTPDLKRESCRAMHCGCPVIKGEKYIAQLWIDWFEQGKENEVEKLLKKAKANSWQVEPVS